VDLRVARALHDAAREEGTRVADNLFTALWKRHAQHAATWRALCLGQAVITVLALVLAFTLLHRPREVVRIGCDGIPQLVRLDVQQYAEPNEREIQAFVRTWAVAYARADSFSAVNDAVYVSRYMVPELREAYRRHMRGTAGQPGLLAQLEAVKRRTEIDPNDLEVRVDTHQYPWAVEVHGERRIVGAADVQRFALVVKLVRAPREQVLEGMLVQGVRDLEVIPPAAETGAQP
jgi:hypothetical protein